MPKRAETELHSRIRSPLFLGNKSIGNRCANFSEYCEHALSSEIEQLLSIWQSLFRGRTSFTRSHMPGPPGPPLLTISSPKAGAPSPRVSSCVKSWGRRSPIGSAIGSAATTPGSAPWLRPDPRARPSGPRGDGRPCSACRERSRRRSCACAFSSRTAFSTSRRVASPFGTRRIAPQMRP